MNCAKDIMTKKLITIKKDTSVVDAINLMIDKKISGLPVINDDNYIIGMVSEKDLLALAFYNSINDEIVFNFMMEDIASLDENINLLDVCEFLMSKNYKRVPILSNNKLVGIISRRDILKYILDK